jgi:hypothetical protein
MAARPSRSGLTGVVLLLSAVAFGGCASGSSPSISAGTAAPAAESSIAAPPTTGSTPAASPAPAPPAASGAAGIVGEWVGIHDCERIVSTLQAAGLDEFALEAVYGNGLVPGATSEADLQDPAHPCIGAVPRQHSHFFTADGAFGSKDFNGQPVDDGTYEIQGDDVIVINDLPFRFHIDGDELTLEPQPVDISACTTKECRFAATWVLMVAMPGTTWKRGTIPG